MVSLLLGEAPVTAVFCTWVWLFKILESLTAESGLQDTSKRNLLSGIILFPITSGFFHIGETLKTGFITDLLASLQAPPARFP
jgi:hypothetical protein